MKTLLVRLLGVVLVVALAAVVGLGISLRPAAKSSVLVAAVPTAAASPSSRRPEVYFLTDGIASDLGGSPAWPQLVSTTRHWTPRLDALPGSGFVAGAATGQSLVQRMVAALQRKPDAVVLEAGKDDQKSDPALVEAAAVTLLDQLRTGLPRAPVFLVGPVSANDEVPPTLVAVDRALARAAKRTGVSYYSALSQGWFRGRSADVSPSGDLLTKSGHRLFADRLLQQLPAALVPPARRASPSASPSSGSGQTVAAPPSASPSA